MNLKLMKDNDSKFGRTPYIYSVGDDFATYRDIMSYLLAPDSMAAGVDKIPGVLDRAAIMLTGNSPSDPRGTIADTAMDYDTFITDMSDGPAGYRPSQDDTSLGGNDAINCFYGFNEDDDIILPLLAINGDAEANGGIGIVYNEVYQLNQSLLYLSFGVPEFTNLLKFYANAMDGDASDFVNNGKTSGSWAYTFGSFMGYVVGGALFLNFPKIAMAYIFSKTVSKVLERDQYITKYYQFRGAMPMYYRYVNTIMIILATNMGLSPGNDTGGGTAVTNSTQSNQDISNMMMDIDDTLDLRHSGSTRDDIARDIDDFLNNPDYANYNAEQLVDLLEEEYDMELAEHLDGIVKDSIIGSMYGEIFGDPATKEVRDIISSVASAKVWGRQAEYRVSIENTGSVPSYFNGAFDIYNILRKRDMRTDVSGMANGYAEATAQGINDPDKYLNDNSYDDESVFAFFADFLPRVVKSLQGADKFIAFKIDKGVDVSESVSNTVGEPAIAGFLNSIGGAAKEFKFSAMGGNIGDGLAANTLEGAAGFLTNALQGAVSTFTGDTLAAAVTGSGTFDIPDVWKSSSFSKSYSFKLTFRTPYGNPVSIFQDVYVPLALLLAGSLPRSIGANSYTTPFICRAYCPGKFAVPNGIFENLNVTRGAAEFGWSRSGLPLVVDVSFTIRDLSPVMHLSMMGVENSIFNIVLETNSTMMEYLNTLGNLSLSQRLLNGEQLEKRMEALSSIVRSTYGNSMFYITELQGTWLGNIIEFMIPDARYEDA